MCNIILSNPCVPGSTGDSLEVWRELDLERVEKDLRGVLSRGITSLAVLLLHSYTSVVHLLLFSTSVQEKCVYARLSSILSGSFLSLPGHLPEPISHLNLFLLSNSIVQLLLLVSLSQWEP